MTETSTSLREMTVSAEPTYDLRAPQLQDAENALYATVSRFLAYEAGLLDQDLLKEWLDLLDDEFTYRIPIRVDRERRAGGNNIYDPADYRINDTKAAMKVRIDRLYTGHAWAEELSSRTCRVVGSVNVQATDEPGTVRATSSSIVYRQRSVNLEWEIVAARHDDRIRLGPDGPRLRSRVVYLTENTLATNNLAIIV